MSRSSVREPLQALESEGTERSDLNGEFEFAISIQNKGSYPAVLRPDFRGRRLTLYFDDVVEGPGAATPTDIEALLVLASSDWPRCASILLRQ